MSPETIRRKDAVEEEELMDDVEELEEEAEEAVVAGPAVSDSRRRRQAKRGVATIDASSAVEPARKDRPTPSQREEAEPKRNFLARWFYRVREYLHEVSVELRKVSWPTREETLRLTWIVIIVTTISALFLGAISLIFGALATEVANATGSSSASLATIVSIVLIVIVSGAWLFRDRLFGGGSE